MSQSAIGFERVVWDSEFFAVSIARVGVPVAGYSELLALLERAKREHIDCLYYLIDCSEARAIREAQRAGFRVVDVRITLACALPEAALAPRIRQARAADVARLREIAAENHRNSRFYSDGNFPGERCDELYALWIQRSVEAGFADAVLVCDGPTAALGYVTCSLGTSGTGSIGLCGVAVEARGQQVGPGLVAAALGWLRQRGMHQATVVTQGNNVSAQRLYQKAGMRTISTEVWLHAWPQLEGRA